MAQLRLKWMPEFEKVVSPKKDVLPDRPPSGRYGRTAIVVPGSFGQAIVRTEFAQDVWGYWCLCTRPRIVPRIVLLSLCLLLVTCRNEGPEVRYNFDKNSDFSKFRTYTWVPLQNDPKIDRLRGEQIKAAVDAEIAKKGLVKTEADTADLYIGYQAAIEKETQFTSYKTDWGLGPGWSGGNLHGAVGGVTTGQMSTIYTGQLALDMYDRKNHWLVWRGVANKTIDIDASQTKQQKNLERAVVTLLKNYPPSSGAN